MGVEKSSEVTFRVDLDSYRSIYTKKPIHGTVSLDSDEGRSPQGINFKMNLSSEAKEKILLPPRRIHKKSKSIG